MSDKPSIFISYSHADTKWLKELDPHLRGLERYAGLNRYDDRQLLGGDDWDAKIKAELDGADIVLLLITANFIGSDYIHRVELPSALKRREKDGCIIIPVLLETCYRKPLLIDDINFLPKDENGALKPLAEWRGARRARGFTQVIEHVHAQIELRRKRGIRETRDVTSSEVDLALYRRRAHAKWSAIDLSSLAAPGTVDADTTIRLGDVFMPQLARGSRPPLSLPRDYLEKQGLDPAEEAAGAQQLAKETLKTRLRTLASGRICRFGGTEGQGDAAAGELFAGGIRRQEEADAARQVFGRDGAGGAVAAAGGASAALLPEG